ncbi:hypothetical protein CGP82_04445 [Campylobacter sp. LR185c]|nr:hypothetical protein CGP82_04445 [Campylobacter sp. LR185c]
MLVLSSGIFYVVGLSSYLQISFLPALKKKIQVSERAFEIENVERVIFIKICKLVFICLKIKKIILVDEAIFTGAIKVDML